MSRPSLIPRLLALVLALALLMAGGVVRLATAQVPTDGEGCPGAGSSTPTGNIDDPDEGQVIAASSTVVRGCFEYGRDTLGALGNITKVTVSLVAGRGQPLPAGSTATFAVDPPARFFKFEWATPALAWNGPYRVRVVVEGSPRPPGEPQKVDAERRFFIEAAPAAPKGLTAEPVGTEGVTVSWDKNKEPDMVLYEVHRAPKDGGFVPIAQTAPQLTTLNDRPPVGEWRYAVIAIRKGAGDNGVASGPSKEAAAAVVTPPAPAPSTTVAAGGGEGGDGSPSTTTQKTGSGVVITSGGTSGGAAAPGARRPSSVDLSRLATLNRSTPRRIQEPDGGFDETLPFTPGDRPAVAEQDDEELGADDPDRELAVGQRPISDDSERRRSLSFVAFGLLLFVMSMAGLWVKGEVKRADDLEVLEPGSPPPPGPLPPPVRPAGPPPAPAAPAPKPASGAAGDAADPLAGMEPLSPPPARAWSVRQPVDAPALDVPEPAADSGRRPGRGPGQRRLPVR